MSWRYDGRIGPCFRPDALSGSPLHSVSGALRDGLLERDAPTSGEQTRARPDDPAHSAAERGRAARERRREAVEARRYALLVGRAHHGERRRGEPGERLPEAAPPDPAALDVTARLDTLDPNRMTPIEALIALSNLKRAAAG